MILKVRNPEDTFGMFHITNNWNVTKLPISNASKLFHIYYECEAIWSNCCMQVQNDLKTKKIVSNINSRKFQIHIYGAYSHDQQNHHRLNLYILFYDIFLVMSRGSCIRYN